MTPNPPPRLNQTAPTGGLGPKELVFGALLLTGIVSIFSVPALSLYRIWFWLKYGYWHTYNIFSLLSEIDLSFNVYKIEFAGVSKVLEWILTQPAEVGLLAFAVLSISAAFSFAFYCGLD